MHKRNLDKIWREGKLVFFALESGEKLIKTIKEKEKAVMEAGEEEPREKKKRKRRDLVEERELRKSIRNLEKKIASFPVSEEVKEGMMKKAFSDLLENREAEIANVDTGAKEKFLSLFTKVKTELSDYKNIESLREIFEILGPWTERQRRKIKKIINLESYREGSEYWKILGEKLEKQGIGLKEIMSLQALFGLPMTGIMDVETINIFAEKLGYKGVNVVIGEETRYKGAKLSEEEKALRIEKRVSRQFERYFDIPYRLTRHALKRGNGIRAARKADKYLKKLENLKGKLSESNQALPEEEQTTVNFDEVIIELKALRNSETYFKIKRDFLGRRNNADKNELNDFYDLFQTVRPSIQGNLALEEDLNGVIQEVAELLGDRSIEVEEGYPESILKFFEAEKLQEGGNPIAAKKLYLEFLKTYPGDLSPEEEIEFSPEIAKAEESLKITARNEIEFAEARLADIERSANMLGTRRLGEEKFGTTKQDALEMVEAQRKSLALALDIINADNGIYTFDTAIKAIELTDGMDKKKYKELFGEDLTTIPPLEAYLMKLKVATSLSTARERAEKDIGNKWDSTGVAYFASNFGMKHEYEGKTVRVEGKIPLPELDVIRTAINEGGDFAFARLPQEKLLEMAEKYKERGLYELSERVYDIYFKDTYKEHAKGELSKERFMAKLKADKEKMEEIDEQIVDYEKHREKSSGKPISPSEKEMIRDQLMKSAWKTALRLNITNDLKGKEGKEAEIWDDFNDDLLQVDRSWYEVWEMTCREWDEFVETLPIDLAALIVTAGASSAVGKATTALVLKKLGTEATKTGLKQAFKQGGKRAALRFMLKELTTVEGRKIGAAKAAGFLAESLTFSEMGIASNAIRTGDIEALTSFDEHMKSFGHSALTLGTLRVANAPLRGLGKVKGVKGSALRLGATATVDTAALTGEAMLFDENMTDSEIASTIRSNLVLSTGIRAGHGVLGAAKGRTLPEMPVEKQIIERKLEIPKAKTEVDLSRAKEIRGIRELETGEVRKRRTPEEEAAREKSGTEEVETVKPPENGNKFETAENTFNESHKNLRRELENKLERLRFMEEAGEISKSKRVQESIKELEEKMRQTKAIVRNIYSGIGGAGEVFRNNKIKEANGKEFNQILKYREELTHVKGLGEVIEELPAKKPVEDINIKRELPMEERVNLAEAWPEGMKLKKIESQDAEFVTALNAVKNNPQSARLLSKVLRKSGKDWELKIPGEQYTIKVTEAELMGKKGQEGDLALEIGLKKYMQIRGKEGMSSIEILTALYKGNIIHDYDVKSEKRLFEKDINAIKVEAILSNMRGRESEFVVTAKTGDVVDKRGMLKKNHNYTVIASDGINRTVEVVDWAKPKSRMKITFSHFMEYFQRVEGLMLKEKITEIEASKPTVEMKVVKGVDIEKTSEGTKPEEGNHSTKRVEIINRQGL